MRVSVVYMETINKHQQPTFPKNNPLIFDYYFNLAVERKLNRKTDQLLQKF